MPILLMLVGPACADGGKYSGESESKSKKDSGDASRSCNGANLVCKSLEVLGVGDDQSMVHSCMTMDGQQGAWVRPSDTGLARNTDDQCAPLAGAHQYREIDTR